MSLTDIPRSKLRLYTIVLACGAFIAGVAPYAARAQSGDAIAQAEHTCIEQGVAPHSVTFDTCVERAAADYNEAQPKAAVTDAYRIAEARQACMSFDLDPQTLGYHQCIADQSDHPRTWALRY